MTHQPTLIGLHRRINDLSAAQGGLFTAAQLDSSLATGWAGGLRALVADDIVERVRPGVFRHLAVPLSNQIQARAAWLATEPGSTAQERRNRHGDRSPGPVIGGAAAARFWDISWFAIGDVIWGSDEASVVTEVDVVAFQRSRVDDQDVHWSPSGFPYTSVERTLADGFDMEGDVEHAAFALADALWARHALDIGHLRALLDAVGTEAWGGPVFDTILGLAGGVPTQPGRAYGAARWHHRRPPGAAHRQ